LFLFAHLPIYAAVALVIAHNGKVIAKATNFAGSNLQGCRFYKA
jgi:hypothetical protein